jgi:putative ABC transport system permease protein
MTFLHLAIKNALRKPIRTLLLIVCIATTFLIYGLTSSFENGSQSAAGSSEDILGVMNAVGMGNPMPVSYLSRIEAEKGVGAAAYSSRLRGHVENERNVVTLSVSQPHELAAVSGEELGLTEDLIDLMLQARENVLIGKALADAQGWEVGQTISFVPQEPIGAEGARGLKLTIVGIFSGKGPGTDTYFLLGQYDYVNALRSRNKDTADVFVVRPDDTTSPAELAVRLDQLFSNSSAPTRTQSEKQFLQAFLRQYADVGLIVQLVVGASFVTLMMIVINTMILAVRERFFEIGVLKTLGFSQLRIMVLIMSESFFIFLVGGAVGMGLSLPASRLAGAELGLVLSPMIVLHGLAITLGLAVAAGVLPTLKAMRIPVVAAFRTR